MIYNTSSGTSLNFKVVGGTTQPTSPKENTIWVNTDVAIPSWAFSTTEPGSPAAGMVWFPVGTSSQVAFNALKKNAVYVYPVSCKQRVGGEWEDRFAENYQDGRWVQFSEIIVDLFLYNSGDPCDSVTGGWKTIGDATVTNGASEMTVKVSGGYKSGGATAVNSIDVSDFNTLVFTGGTAGTNFSDFVIRVRQDATVKASKTAAKSASLDISSLSGEHTVDLYCSNGQSSGRTISFSEIRLTK